MVEKGDPPTDIQILRTTGPLLGFKVVKLDQLLPELFELGERREAAHHRCVPDAPQYSTAFYVVEGTNRIGFESGSEIALKPGSVGFLPPNCHHWQHYGPEPTHRVLWVGFALTAVATRHPEWNLSSSLQRAHFAHDSTHLERFFRQIIREATTPSVLRSSGLRLALDTLLLEIVRDIVEPSKISSLISVHPAIAKALGILETRFKKNWTLVELAEEVGISRSRLAELFTLEVGSSIHKFLNKLRVRHAEVLLGQSNLSIGEIALECGFATIQHFSRIFKEVNGQAPLNFRRRSEYRTAEPRLLSKAS
jgi:AraC family transcriptional regulator, arabinose operon regulatory protein